MKMNAGAWIGIAGGILGLLIGVIAVVTTAGRVGFYIGIGILAFFGGMFYLFYRIFFKSLINASRLQKTGLPGTARIVEVRDTGVTINKSPLVKLILEVKNNFGQRYTAETRTMVSRINPRVLVPGSEVPVKIDPTNEMNVVLDASATISSSTIVAVSRLDKEKLKAELEQVHKDNEALLVSGRPARAIIKKNTFLGVNITGNNPYVELELEVLPDHAPSFTGKAKAAISEISLPKYQPGCTIYVKYDLYDNSKVVVDYT